MLALFWYFEFLQLVHFEEIGFAEFNFLCVKIDAKVVFISLLLKNEHFNEFKNFRIEIINITKYVGTVLVFRISTTGPF